MIKEITNNDLPTINILVKELDKNEEITADLLKHSHLKYIAYKSNNNIKGFLKYTKTVDHIEIEYIYIKQESRRQKIATNLIKYVIELDQDIYLEVKATNISARTLYENLGFTKINIRKKYYKNEDAIIYKRSADNGK